MRAWIMGVVLLVGGVAVAQPAAPVASPAPWTQLFLWRIEGARPSYLFGTMHLPDARTAHLPQPITDALAATDGVALELRMDFVSQVEIAVRMRAPAGRSVVEVAEPALVERLHKLVTAHHGAWPMIAHARPWMAAVLLSFMTDKPQRGAPLDVALHDWALDHQKPSDGLETVVEQSTMGDALSLADQLAVLEEAVARSEAGKGSPEGLREAYFAGDERRALAYINDPRPSRASARLTKIVLAERNVRLAERIRARLQTGTPTFFAVGLGHILGKGGIVERLQRAGFTLTRVR